MHETEKQKREEYFKLFLELLKTIQHYYLEKRNKIDKNSRFSSARAFLDETEILDMEYNALTQYLISNKGKYMKSVQPGELLSEIIRTAPLKADQNNHDQEDSIKDDLNRLAKLAYNYDARAIEQKIIDLKNLLID